MYILWRNQCYTNNGGKLKYKLNYKSSLLQFLLGLLLS